MKKLLITTLLLISPTLVFAQQAVLNDISIKQGDLNVQNGIIANNQAAITAANAAITAAQAQIAIDNAAIANDTAINNAYLAATASTPAGVNWDSFVADEQAPTPIRFAQFSEFNSGINWTSMVPQLGVNCVNSESGVNWSNWGTCKANGMTPGTSFGGYATGVAAFWCGNGKIAGTC